MGKQGPCYHCGVTSTPLWRNGPPEKPVLCNACGSRWRTKGSLANYTPLHSRADMVDFEEQKAAVRVKSISINKNKEVKFLKRKQSYDNSMANGGVALAFDYNQFSQKSVDEDTTTNRSSSGSAMSNSDAQFGSADVSDLTGPAQSVVWDSMVPSRKRTCVNRPKQSSVEKLTKDLHAIMNEQQSSCFSETSEEDLLLESVTTPMCSFEMGNGAVLFRDPRSITKEEESEASSLSVDPKQYNKSIEVYSQRLGPPPYSGGKGLIFPSPSPRIVKIRRSNHEQENGGENLKRNTLQHEKLHILGNHNSPLRGINLKDVINFEEFVKQLTDQEQEQLLKYLPSVDTTELPHSLKNLFDSSEFKENLSSFQKLLADGVFDNSFIGAKAEECKKLKGLALSSFAKSKWVECHDRLIKESRSSSSGGFGMARPQAGKRLRDIQSQNFIDGRGTMMLNPKRLIAKGNSSSSYENKDFVMESDGSCFSPRSLFALPTDSCNFMLDSPFVDDNSNSDQDVLVDVPSNSSFPQAELLISNQSFMSWQQASTSSSSVSPRPLHPR